MDELRGMEQVQSLAVVFARQGSSASRKFALTCRCYGYNIADRMTELTIDREAAIQA